MPLHKSDRQSPKSGHGAGAVLSMPPRPMPPTGLTDAVLEALPYTVAVLDRAGTIVAVNITWRARENGAPDLAEASIGLNYLPVSRDSTGPDSAQA